MTFAPIWAAWAVMVAACGEDGGGRATTAGSDGGLVTIGTTGEDVGTGTGAITSVESGETSGATAPQDGGSDGISSTDPSDGSAATPRFDVMVSPGETGNADEQHCAKVDFLFVVDNSGSMLNEQMNLQASFAGFIDAIVNVVGVNDFQILVTDTDAASSLGGSCFGATCMAGACTCPFNLDCCCEQACADPANMTCAGMPCSVYVGGTTCDTRLGAGLVKDRAGADCGFDPAHRYLLPSEPDLTTKFGCAVVAGNQGNNSERTMEAMMEAIAPLNVPGECNEGFVRDDAVLVVTIITDEEDDPADAMGLDMDQNSPGDPAAWKQAVLDVKFGDEAAVVMLGLIGDTGEPGAVCAQLNPTTLTGAEPSPRLRTFVESFGFGQWAPVCEPDYAPFFASAVSVIGTACEGYQPPQ